MKYFLTSLFLLTSFTANASDVEIVNVTASQGNGLWRFDVTLRHDDSGWDHYADGWKIFMEDGTELGVRILAHPHVNEQPFTRSLAAVQIPYGVERVIIRAKDNLSDWPDEFYLFDLPNE